MTYKRFLEIALKIGFSEYRAAYLWQTRTKYFISEKQIREWLKNKSKSKDKDKVLEKFITFEEFWKLGTNFGISDAAIKGLWKSRKSNYMNKEQLMKTFAFLSVLSDSIHSS